MIVGDHFAGKPPILQQIAAVIFHKKNILVVYGISTVISPWAERVLDLSPCQTVK